ncbi:MAG: hypothetical protein CMI13_08150 [Oleibacter sp.]|nr:hypothetical protein [Thalassolituus sp.]|tara:strand:+ start:561 stop:980 length:420 start_codon:yes stop_codon:yes gene_type:complete
MTAVLHFYEKPGCINNTKQKRILRNCGVELEAHSLLTEQWQKEELRRFFHGHPVAEWFNPSAPAVKEKRIRPAECSADEALDAMLKDPLLIRRPLMKMGDWYSVGFEWERLQQALDIQPQAAEQVAVPQGIEACAHTAE